MPMPVREITRKDIADAVAGLGARPVANQSLKHVKGMFSFCWIRE
jgi:hypothetical protein